MRAYLVLFHVLLHLVLASAQFHIEKCAAWNSDLEFVYTNMSLPGHNRTDFKCYKISSMLDTTTKVYCESRRHTVCACSAMPKWSASDLSPLSLEYFSRRGDSRVFFNGERNGTGNYFSLFVEGGFLSMLPENLCDYPQTLEMHFPRNKIKTLRNLGCVEKLTDVNLSFNKIKRILKSFFSGLSRLWYLNLSYNEISYIEPGSFNDETLDLVHLDVSHNYIKFLDISNVFLSKIFCRISYAYNLIWDFSNEAQNPINVTDQFAEEGFVDFSYNVIERLPRDERLDLVYSFLGTHVLHRLIIRLVGNPLICDCFLEEFLWYIGKIETVYDIDDDYLGYRCKLPSTLENVSIVRSFIYKNNFDQLVCKLSHCPETCSCVFQSSKFRIIVDCTESFNDTVLPDFDFTKMTENVRNHSKILSSVINVYLSGRHVKTLDQRNYFLNASYFDLSYNSVEMITDRFLVSFPPQQNIKINMSSNTGILRLPKALQLLKSSSVVLSNTTVLCDCELMSWFKQWLGAGREDDSKKGIMCKVGERFLPLGNVTESDVDCVVNLPNYNLAFIVGSLVIFIIVLYYIFENYGIYIFVIWRRFGRREPRGISVFEYDVYISVDEQNPLALHYVRTEFIPLLENFPLKTFILLRDSDVGDVIQECIIENMNSSKTYVFFLTNAVLNERDSIFGKEWKHAWSNYKSKRGHNIILINFDLLRLTDVKDQCMKANMACGNCVNFYRPGFTARIKALLKKREEGLPNVCDKTSKVIFPGTIHSMNA